MVLLDKFDKLLTFRTIDFAKTRRKETAKRLKKEVKGG